MIRKSVALILLAICMGGALVSCKGKDTEDKKIKDLEFTVVSPDNIQDEILARIEENKEKGFHLSFSDGEYLYIAIGYGEQKTGGYSIAVNELYLAENGVYVDTELIGPSGNDTTGDKASYPYIVIKTEDIQKSVIFD